jgi:hypothetical protein
MRSYSQKPIGVIYEHAEQFNPLFSALSIRGIPFVRINPADHYYDPHKAEIPYSLLFNDMSTPLYCDRSASAIIQTIEYIRHLEGNDFGFIQGRLINGSKAADLFASRAKQLSIFASLGLVFPKTLIVNSINRLLAVLDDLKFPIVIKGNLASHTGSTLRLNSIVDLIEAVGDESIRLDGNNIVLVQEYIRPKGNYIVRAETLNGRVIEAVKIYIGDDQRDGLPIEVKTESFTLSHEVNKTIERIVHTARVEVGSVAYLTDSSTNKINFYSIRPHTCAYSVGAGNQAINIAETIVTYIEQRLHKIREVELAL